MDVQNSVRSVDRALAILDSFSEKHRALSLAQIAKKVSLPTTTTLRILTTLEQNGFVLKDSANGTYSLGWKLAKLGNIAFAGLDVCTVAYPYIEQMHAKYNESFGLYVAEGKERICVARIDSTHSFRQCVTIGSSRPLDTGAAGHVLLAFLKTPIVDEILKYSTCTTPKLLEKTRKDMYSISYGEYIPGLTSVAAPVFNHDGTIAAALFVTGPDVRISPLLEEYIEIIKSNAESISLQMGYGKE